MAYACTAATDSWKLTAAMWNELMDVVTSWWNWAPAMSTDSLNAQMSFSLHSDTCDSDEAFIPIKNSVQWICMEKTERTAQNCEDARKTCSDAWKRLAEPWEWKYACQNASSYWLSDMTNNWEWDSNFAQPVDYGGSDWVGAAIAGSWDCHYAGWGWVGYSSGSEDSNTFRCVR